ncbi:MAG: GxxExxY protein [Phycisphaerales bacterium]|nr:GxxExxY protein [Phycisphaerales bacterium]
MTERVIASAMEVHSALGPGLLERLYEDALTLEFRSSSIPFARQHCVKVAYKGTPIGEQILDLVVGGLIVVELKAVEAVHEIHLRQLVSYMRSGRMPVGLILNFNTVQLKAGIHRRVLTQFLPPTPPVQLIGQSISQHPLRSSPQPPRS